MTFEIALSGINAATADLDVTGNNIANANTVGFKASRAEFADMYATAYGDLRKSVMGGGVQLSDLKQMFTQGSIDFTGNNLDLAINGQGFFVLSGEAGLVYSRAGAFHVDRDGYVVNAQGLRLQVFPALDRDGTAFNTSSLSDLQIPGSEGPPNATQDVTIAMNLDAMADDLSAAAPFDPSDPTTFNYSTSVTVYDSLGGAHTATTYFRNAGSLSWEVHSVVDGDTSQTTAVQTLTFNSDGTLASGSPANFGTFNPANGAAPLDMTFDFSRTTQYGSAFAVSTLSQDGYTTGRLSGIDIDESGVVSARFTNGQFMALAELVLANFPNPQGLSQTGGTAWAETFASGPVNMGEAGTGSFGMVQSGGLESSNVDLTAELVNLISAQRNFQANAQVITAADTVTQTVINIR